MYTFTNKEGVVEQVETERWQWGVVYLDGKEFRQFDSDTQKFHQFKEISKAKVSMFVMSCPELNKRIDLVVTPNMQLFHFYRQMFLEHGTEDERRVKVYVYGWKDTDTGATTYNYIMPDDRVLTANHDLPDLTRYGL